MKRCDLTKGLVFFLTIIITLCCGLIPSSWAEDDVVCTNRTLKGTYGFSQSGIILVPTGNGPEEHTFDCVGTFTANGRGDIEGVETIKAGKDTKFTYEADFAGEYYINEDCRGEAEVIAKTPIGLMPITISLVICGQKGNNVHMLNTVVGNTEPSVLGIGIKITNDD